MRPAEMGDVVKSRREKASSGNPSPVATNRELVLLPETAFQRMVALERKRAERAAKPCLLMLLEPGDAPFSLHRQQVLEKMVEALPAFSRETDMAGWHRKDHTLGVIFTAIDPEGIDHILKTMLSRLKHALRSSLGHEQANRINISFELFPERRQGEVGYTKMKPDFEGTLRDERRGAQSIS